MINLLNDALKLNLFHNLDIKIATILNHKDNDSLLLLIFTLLSYNTRIGNTCLLIKDINLKFLIDELKHEIVFKIWNAAGTPNYEIIYHKLKNCFAVSNSEEIKTKPLVLYKNKLYFYNMWNNEKKIAIFFNSNTIKKINEKKFSDILNTIFPYSKKINWQKIAVAIAITNKVSIISGGPGTGKTTIIINLLYSLIKLYNKLIIKLAAPTGKAAIKLIFLLQQNLSKLKLSKQEYELIPKQAQTIHSLLKINPNTNNVYYHENNKLFLDVLIIDEASMIDLSMMNKIIDALPKHAYFIILGDKNQLSSVEPGSVFSDLCSFSKLGYDIKKIIQLKKITGFNLLKFKSELKSNLQNKICILHKNYRFDKSSEIGKFANAIKNNKKKILHKFISQNKKYIIFDNIESSIDYQKLLLDIVNNYYYYYLRLIKKKNIRNILTIFNKYRLLVGLKHGPYGVIELNQKIEQILFRKNIIKLFPKKYDHNYEGRPIIITKNDYNNKIFNGDIGIILNDTEDSKLKAYFLLPNGNIKKIKLISLPPHETAFAMTVHKSQGSEFESISLVLPENINKIITNEFIYTAITRAKNRIHIYGKKNIFFNAINTKVKRNSGLIERILNMKI